jgi:hypothetical protein
MAGGHLPASAAPVAAFGESGNKVNLKLSTLTSYYNCSAVAVRRHGNASSDVDVERGHHPRSATRGA